jgi:hypothetical protein
MRTAFLILLAVIPHPGWDMIATWHGPGWYAEIDGVPVMGVFATKRECLVQRFDQPSTCRRIRTEADFPQPILDMPPLPAGRHK